jgi:hypothetical protein
MKIRFIIPIFISTMICNGAFVQAHTTYIVESNPVVVVETQPPAEKVEEVTTCPGEGYHWQKGRWCWNGGWVWQGGCWVQRPEGKSEYVSGYWKKNHHHWVWVESYWR